MSISATYAQGLSKAHKAYNLPTIEDTTQETIQDSLTDIKDVHFKISELSLFSPNETLEDISTRDLAYLLVPYVMAELQGRVRTTSRTERLASLKEIKTYLVRFLSLLETYEIIPEDERVLYSHSGSNMTDHTKRRELKINQFKKEKELTARIETIQKRTGRRPTVDSTSTPSEFELISSLISISPSDSDEELDSGTEDIIRETTLLVLRLIYTKAQSELESMDQELELLRNAPPSPTLGPLEGIDGNGKKRESDSDMWKLDVPTSSRSLVDGKGPLLDSSGKPLRPFTILPSDAAERARLQAGVFGPGHNLPTMSIDEYLEIERQRGKFISGGGPASQAIPTSSEQLKIDSEMDGTVEAEEKAEQKRLKDENWARFTDENPKGAGNTMNRG